MSAYLSVFGAKRTCRDRGLGISSGEIAMIATATVVIRTSPSG
jgi:hypothetical protein